MKSRGDDKSGGDDDGGDNDGSGEDGGSGDIDGPHIDDGAATLAVDTVGIVCLVGMFGVAILAFSLSSSLRLADLAFISDRCASSSIWRLDGSIGR